MKINKQKLQRIHKGLKYQIKKNSNYSDWSCGNRMCLTINNASRVMALIDQLEKLLLDEI